MHSDKLICPLKLNLKVSITKVTGTWNSKILYATNSHYDATINQIFKTPTELQVIGLLSSIFIFKACISYYFYFAKIKPLKSDKKCILFHLNCSFGSCNIQILGENWKVENGVIMKSWNWKTGFLEKLEKLSWIKGSKMVGYWHSLRLSLKTKK